MIRLAVGAAAIPEAARQRHAHFLVAAQQPDGGFAGRAGGSDPYYTSFALRALAILGKLYGPVAGKTAAFLKTQSPHGEPLIDSISSVFGAALLDMSAGEDVFGAAKSSWFRTLTGRLEQLRRDDGGYAKGPRGAAGSTYQTFLTLTCLQLMDHALPKPDGVTQFILSQQSETGGFLEIRVGKRAGTNPTAAAIGVLKTLGTLDHRTRTRTIAFLATMQNQEGGFLANSRIPTADILSTFTALMTLADLDGLDAIDHQAALRYVRSQEHPDGGFQAAVWDTTRDIEYTFYGLGSLALLAPLGAEKE